MKVIYSKTIGLVYKSIFVFTILFGGLFIMNNAQAALDYRSLPMLEVDGNDLHLGDIIVEGSVDRNGNCNLNTFRIRMTTTVNSNPHWVGVLLDNSVCQAVVNAIWEGELDAGPTDVIKPLLDITDAISPTLPTSQISNLEEVYVSSFLNMPSKTSEQKVFMYGYGGSWDHLTYARTKITFSYNSSSATISSYSGGCWGKTMPWYAWVVDNCSYASVLLGPASQVWVRVRGDFHCEPPGTAPCNISNPDGYYHSLYNEVRGNKNGTSECLGWYSGIIVSGIDKEILQGCS